MTNFITNRATMNKKLFLMTVCLLFTIYSNGQSNWQWGKRGGSSTASGAGGTDETVVDMATDVHGNIYTISNVWSPGLDIDGHTKTGYGGSDILLSSFKCDGTYRWSKIIGGIYNDKSVAVKTDTIGGVYITGFLQTLSSSLHIDADSSWTGGGNKSLFLAKFDTSGTYKWFRMPQADTVSGYSYSNTGPYDMDVDGAGNIYLFCALAHGAYVGGTYIVASNSIHMLKYNSSGIFQSGVQMQLTCSGGASPLFKMKRNHKNGKFLITGTPPTSSTITFGSTTITHTLYLSCFNNAGISLWTKQNTNNASNGPLGRPAIDQSGNIYISGQAVDADNFNSYIVSNPMGPAGTVFIDKLDSAGVNIWGANALSTDEIECGAVAVNGSQVVIAGSYPGTFKWGSDSLVHSSGCGYSPFIVRFNALTGAPIHIDSLATGCGDDAHPSCITTDKSGNIYIGGFFGSTLTVNGTTVTSSGGGSDLFVAKYGTAICGCTLPTSSFTSVGTHTVNFTYTGTTTYDSVRWTFSDGGTSTLATPVHVFTATGTYTACVTVYTPCGSDVHCQTVNVTVAIGGVATAGFENVNIYPNPVSGQLIIEDVAIGTVINLYNIVGTEVYSGTAASGHEQIDVQQMPPGSYIIQLTDKEGNRIKRSIIKQ